MTPELVDYLLYEPEKDSGILWIRFNRPERMNALHLPDSLRKLHFH